MRTATHAADPVVELEYETFGNAGDPPVVLVMGFGQQMIAWDATFCTRLAAREFFVVRFDNRDVGLSTQLTGAPGAARPNIPQILSGDRSTVAYGLEDMADDTAALIASLGLVAAHVVGVSMGAMIAQTLAVRHPERVA